MTDLTVNVWQDFELDTLNGTNLDGRDHFVTTGVWSVTDASTKLSTSTTGEKACTATFGGVSDTGTRGLKYDSAGGAQAYLSFGHPAQRTQMSWGFWFKIVGAAFFSSFSEYDLCRNSTDLGTLPSLIKVVDDTNETRFHLFVPSTYSAGIPIQENTWYWVTGKHVKNGTVVASLYNDSGVQVGVEQSIAVGNENLTEFLFGVFAGGPDVASSIYFDDLIMDWTNATYPLGPPLTLGTAVGRRNSYDDDGAVVVDTLSDVTGLRAWVDYIPVSVVTDTPTKKWRVDSDGFIPVVEDA